MSRSDGRRARRRPTRPDPSEETAVWLAELEQLAERDHRAEDEEEWARTLRSKRNGMTGEYPAQQPPPARSQPAPPPFPEYPAAHGPEFGYPPAAPAAPQPEPRQEWPPAPAAPPPAVDPGWLNPPLSSNPPHPLADNGNGYGNGMSNGYGNGLGNGMGNGLGGGAPASDPPSATGSGSGPGMRWDEWDQGSQASGGHSYAAWPPEPAGEPAPWEAGSGYGHAAYGDTGSMPAQPPPAPEPWQPGYQDDSWSQSPSSTGQFPAVPQARQPEPWELPPAPAPEPEPWTAATGAWPAPEPARAPEPKPRDQLPRWPDDGLTADTGVWQPDPGRWTDQPWNPAPASPPPYQAPAPSPPQAPPPPQAPMADSHPTLPVARLQPPPFSEPPVARRTPPRAAGPDDEQVVGLGGHQPSMQASEATPSMADRWRPPQAPPRPSPSEPSWRRSGGPGSAFVDEDEEDRAFGRYAGDRASNGGRRPAWPRMIALLSWIVLLMVLCWYYVFPWLEHVLPANF